jgi:hypothetical protein
MGEGVGLEEEGEEHREAGQGLAEVEVRMTAP